MALFDTDILIDHLRGISGAQEALFKFKHEENYCSVITIGEILFGMRKEEKENTLTLLNNFIDAPINKEIVFLANDIRTHAKGHKLQLFDCIILATALKLNQILVTRNSKHYPDQRIRLFIPPY
jgi:predicted nucleic acid-binding protein